jgi:REP element-mobilizing transposase RayT
MPDPEYDFGDLAWRHVVVGTLRGWNFADERGFRSRGHRIHSSGDYKNPPPKGEHRKLHEWHVKRHVGPRVEIPQPMRGKLGAAFVRKSIALGYTIIAASVSAKHAHFLVLLPDDYRKERAVIGKAKNISSYVVRDEMPGRIWAAGGRFRLIKNRKHQLNVFRYISQRQEKGAWTWNMFQPVPPEE